MQTVKPRAKLIATRSGKKRVWRVCTPGCWAWGFTLDRALATWRERLLNQMVQR
jgi:hypothetical protein